MAYKALDYLVNGKVGSRRVELSRSNLDMLRKLIDSIKCSLGYLIRFWLR